MKILHITNKNVKSMFRDKTTLLTIIIYPIIFVLIMGLSIGGMSDTSYDIGVVNLDDSSNAQNYGNLLINNITGYSVNDNEGSMFNVIEYNSIDEAHNALNNKDIPILIVIPENFSKDMQSLTSSDSRTIPEIQVNGDFTSTETIIAYSILSQPIESFQTSILHEVYGISTESMSVNITQSGGEIDTDSFTELNLLLPAIIIFEIITMMTTMTAYISKETEDGTLNRLRISKMKNYDYILGNFISWGILTIIQVIILLVLAVLLGFNLQGGITTIILILLLCAIASLSTTSLSLIIISLTKTSTQATTLAGLISIPLSLVSGVIEISALKLDLNGFILNLYDFMPWHYTLDGMKEVLNSSANLLTISNDITISLVLGLVIFAISLILFSRKLNSIE